MSLSPKLLDDRERLEEIYNLRVDAWENSSRSDLVNRKLFPNGWTDKQDETAIHFVVEDEKRIVASARLNIVNSIDELIDKAIFEQFSLPEESPIGLFSRLVVLPDYRNLGLSSKLDQIRHEYAKKNNAKFLLVVSGESKRVESLMKRGWTVLGKTKVKYHSESLSEKYSDALIFKENDGICVWGRNMNEYFRMFNFEESDKNKKILSVADGPASFNYEMATRRKAVTSLDPIYALTKIEIEEKIRISTQKMIDKFNNKKSLFTVKNSEDTNELIQRRLSAMELFLQDYEKGKNEGRYVSGEFPNIPFENDSFDLCICANLLFLFEEHFTDETHIKSIEEMLRVAKEARIFPLYNRQGKISRHLNSTISHFSANYETKIEDVNYEVYKNGNKQLIIKK